MSDWEEIEDFHHVFTQERADLFDSIWEAASKNEAENAQAILEDAGYEFDEGERVTAISLKGSPDDILGTYYVAKVRLGPAPNPALIARLTNPW